MAEAVRAAEREAAISIEDKDAALAAKSRAEIDAQLRYPPQPVLGAPVSAPATPR